MLPFFYINCTAYSRDQLVCFMWLLFLQTSGPLGASLQNFLRQNPSFTADRKTSKLAIHIITISLTEFSMSWAFHKVGSVKQSSLINKSERSWNLIPILLKSEIFYLGSDEFFLKSLRSSVKSFTMKTNGYIQCPDIVWWFGKENFLKISWHLWYMLKQYAPLSENWKACCVFVLFF